MFLVTLQEKLFLNQLCPVLGDLKWFGRIGQVSRLRTSI